MSVSLKALVVVAIAAIAGVIGHQLNSHPRVQNAITRASLEVDKEGVRYLSWLGFSCGVEAWDVKTMRDAAASSVNLTPQATNIVKLAALAGAGGQRAQPPQAYKLTLTHLVAYKLEADSDIHLVLRSTLGSHPTMIAEIPNPQCSQGSVVLAGITQARAAFVARFGQPQTYFVNLDKLVTVVGIGFFDFAHGQTGAAQNQIELHPVIALL